MFCYLSCLICQNNDKIFKKIILKINILQFSFVFVYLHSLSQLNIEDILFAADTECRKIFYLQYHKNIILEEIIRRNNYISVLLLFLSTEYKGWSAFYNKKLSSLCLCLSCKLQTPSYIFGPLAQERKNGSSYCPWK